jgi:hypothetical protein
VDVGGEHHLDVLLPLGQRLGATSFGRHDWRLGFRKRAPCARERRGREGTGGGGAGGRDGLGARLLIWAGSCGIKP